MHGAARDSPKSNDAHDILKDIADRVLVNEDHQVLLLHSSVDHPTLGI